MKNKNLRNAKKAKNDEFYTRLTDIEKELKHYKDQFKDKIVYCNCDDARESNFFKFFSLNFEHYGLKKLITTSYNKNGHGTILTYEGDKNGNHMVDDNEIQVNELKGNGDFRSEECIELLKQADIVVTNPPFSLFREYVAQLVEYGKKFLIIGNGNAVTYKEIFPLIKENKLWIGASKGMGGKAMEFIVSKDFYDPSKGSLNRIENGVCYVGVMMCCWFTNMEHSKRHEPLILINKYNEKDYPKYDNYDAIECSKVVNIPNDYNGVIGVPISFLDKYCPEQFEIIGLDRYAEGNKYPNKRMFINGKEIYARILIRRK